jgi:hypothetical protein
LIDKWLFFMTEARSLEQVPEEMTQVPEIKKAFYISKKTII